jgi:hypothetical protein
MDVGLGIAGIICLAMAIGHQSIGVIWVLPSITEENVPGTPFGPRSMTISMLRVTWYIVTVFAACVGGLLLTLAIVETADPKIVVLRWLAAMWVAATAMATSVVVRRAGSLRGMLRLPVPFLWVIVAALCWSAAP